jgi:hypothetical protein
MQWRCVLGTVFHRAAAGSPAGSPSQRSSGADVTRDSDVVALSAGQKDEFAYSSSRGNDHDLNCAAGGVIGN